MQADVQALLETQFFNNSLEAYLLAVGVGAAVWSGLWIFRAVIVRQLKRAAAKTDTDFDDLIVEIFRSFNLPFYLLLAVGAGAQYIAWPAFVSKAGYWLAAGILVYAGIRAATRLVDYFFRRVARKRLAEDANFDPSVVRLLGRAMKFAVWIAALLLLAQNFGFDVTALVAGLGIGGLAVAFALQNVLSDVFASFSLYFDKPFKTGDFIAVGQDMGTVKHIGVKSTRLVSLWGEEIVLPNKQLTEERIHNYRKAENRRAMFTFQLPYDTASSKLRKVPGIVREIFEKLEGATLDRAHVKELGESGFVVEVMYQVDTADYTAYMDIRQEVNLRLHELLEKEGIAMGYPTQTVHLAKERSR